MTNYGVKTIYNTKYVSIVVNEERGPRGLGKNDLGRKMDKTEAGYMSPPANILSEITADRFCCGNCVRYDRALSSCSVVDGTDIEEKGCCNWYGTRGTIYKDLESGMQIATDFRSANIPIAGGAVGSLEAYSIVNGLPRPEINMEKLKEDFKKSLEASFKTLNNGIKKQSSYSYSSRNRNTRGEDEVTLQVREDTDSEGEKKKYKKKKKKKSWCNVV